MGHAKKKRCKVYTKVYKVFVFGGKRTFGNWRFTANFLIYNNIGFFNISADLQQNILFFANIPINNQKNLQYLGNF